MVPRRDDGVPANDNGALAGAEMVVDGSSGDPGRTRNRCPSRIQFRNVSAFIPSRLDTAVIAAHSLG